MSYLDKSHLITLLFISITISTIISGCTVISGVKTDNEGNKYIYGKGWGFRRGEIHPDGTMIIEKHEPISEPDINLK